MQVERTRAWISESLRSGLNYSLPHSLFGLGELPNPSEPLFLFYKMKIHKIKKT